MVLKHYRKFIPAVLVIIAFLFGQAMCELALPGYMADIIDKGIVKGDHPYIYRAGALMLLVSLGSIAFAILSSLIASRVAAGAARDIRSSLFRKVTFLSEAELDQFSTASLITRSTNDIQTIQQVSVMALRMAFYAPILGIGALLKALNTSPSLTWTIGVALASIFVIMGILFSLVIPKFKAIQKKLDRLNLIIGERLSGLQVIRAFNSQGQEGLRFDEENRGLMKISIFVNRAMSFLFPALMLIMNSVNVLVLWVGSHMIEGGNLQIGDMLAFLQYAMQIIMSFLFITMVFFMIPRAAVSGQRISAVLKVTPQIHDNPHAEDLPDPQGVLEFQDVGFAYPDGEEKALSHISFTAKPGTTTAIIGGTGSGKSTLVRLIPRFFDPTEGRILLDGVDLRDLPQRALRDKIGYVPQKSVLFSGTVGSNLRQGKKDATMEEMQGALETAQALSFVENMPQWLDSTISQGGTDLSGGQKQRLSIARALIKDPLILLFDDSFSALDFTTDAALRRSLKDNAKDATIVLVAQRINTIMDADQIIVMDQGKIVSTGRHGELMATCNIYREIASSQLSEEELKKEAWS